MRTVTVRRGFTLVEGLIALLVGIVCVGLSSSLLVHALSTFKRSEERLDPREAAQMALTRLRLALLDSIEYAIDPDGARIRFVTAQGIGHVRFDAAAGKLLQKPAGSERETVLVPRGVRSFVLESRFAGYVRATLKIERPVAGGRLSGLGSVQLADDIAIPALALREFDVPWRGHLEQEQLASTAGRTLSR